MDSYELMRPRIEAETPRTAFGLEARGYGIVTLHRPSNVDRKETLEEVRKHQVRNRFDQF